MSNNTEEDEPCVRPGITLRTDGYRYYGMVYTAVNLLVVVVSLVLWLKYRGKSSYLYNRNFSSIWLAALGFVFDIATGSFTRTSADENSFQNSCFMSTFPYFMVVPCLFLAGILRVSLFLNRYHYNKKLSDSFEASRYSRAKSFNIGSSRSLKRLKNRAGEIFATRIAIITLAIIAFLALILTAGSCPDIGRSTNCEVATLQGSRTYNWSLVVAMFVVFAFIYYVHQKTQQYPDAFGILYEVRTILIVATLISIPAAFLASNDVGNFLTMDPQRFGFELILEYGILFVFYYGVPYQIYLGTKVLKNGVILREITLNKLLENSIGRALFRQHLVNEFSVENINFIEAVDAYRSLFSESKDPNLIVDSATMIFRNFIGQDASSRLNISAVVSSEVTELFLNGQFLENLFDHVYNEVYNLMSRDSYLRFRRTREFKNYIGETEAMTVL